MTNILQIPQLSGAQTSFALTTNTQWLDQISFIQPGFPAPFSISGCGLTSGSNIITCPTTVPIIPGLTLAQVAGLPIITSIPPLCFVLGVTSQTTFTIGDGYGNPFSATASNPNTSLSFNPPPLDLTGISFICSIAQQGVANRIILTAQTSDGTIVNGKAAGTIQFNVPQAAVAQLRPGNYSLDIIASDGSYTLNLFPQGPASVSVTAGVSAAVLLQSTAPRPPGQ